MKNSYQRGFTLIETLVYISLYAIIISGALAAVYSILESSAHNQAQAMVQEEGTYLIGKIDWVATNIVSIQSPAPGPIGGASLAVTKYDGTTATIRQTDATLEFADNANPFVVLNNANIGVSDVTFIHTLPTSDGINPESVSSIITVHATTSDGHVFSRNFSTVKYLRK